MAGNGACAFAFVTPTSGQPANTPRHNPSSTFPNFERISRSPVSEFGQTGRCGSFPWREKSPRHPIVLHLLAEAELRVVTQSTKNTGDGVFTAPPTLHKEVVSKQ
jgi:hypothetical protein